MQKKLLVLAIIMIVAVGGGIFYLSSSSNDKAAKQEMAESGTPSPSQTTLPENQPASSAPGAYVDYNQSVIADTKGTKILFFHAPWCPQCRALEKDIKAQQVPSNVTIIKVDYDSNQALRQKYGVTLQTSVVKVDDQGNLVSKFVAYDNPSLAAIKENLL